MISRLFIFPTCLLCMLLAFGCSARHQSDTVIGESQSAEDAEYGVRLTQSVDRNSIGIAERVWFSAQWSWEGDLVTTLEEPDWDETDWSVIESVEIPVSRTDNNYQAGKKWLIEPFLPGAYSVPSAELRFATFDEQSNTLRTEPIEIRVSGVLPDTDSGELNPIADLAGLDDSDSPPPLPIWMIALGGAATIACIVLYFVYRNIRNVTVPSVFDQLKAIANMDDHESAYSELELVYESLDERLRNTTEFREMISACQRARFSPETDDRLSAKRLANHTLTLLGHTDGSEAL